MWQSERIYQCAYCEKEFLDYYIGSSYEGGSEELDFRPARPYGKYIGRMYGKSCPHCGYTAPDIEETIANKKMIAEIMCGKEYISCFYRALPDGYIKNFYRQFIIEKGLNNTKSQIIALQHAAWMADDEPEHTEIAKELRLETIPLLKGYLESGIAETDPGEYERSFLILVDFYRRTGQFIEAIKLCITLPYLHEPSYQSALRYQKDLAVAADTKIYDFRSVYENYPWKKDVEPDEGTTAAFSLDELLDTESYNKTNEERDCLKLCEEYPSIKDLYYSTRNNPNQKGLLYSYFYYRTFSRRYMYDILELIEENPGETVFVGCLNDFSDYLSKFEIQNYYDICMRKE